MLIDLRSDTVTRPGKEMLDAMMNATVGDDVFGDDPTVNELEEKMAQLLGKEAAVFCPSGSMCNQIAIQLHTRPGDEVICDRYSHVYSYEGGGMARNAGASARVIHTEHGRFTAEDVLTNINPDDSHYPRTTTVSIENTCNKGGGCYWDIEEIKKIREVCNTHNLRMHLDGARLFNALTETGENAADYGALFDTVSICLSKGLGAPVGSVLITSKANIKEARRIRKALGGGMRQAGFLAAAGIYALDNNMELLKADHQRAKTIGETLTDLPFVQEVMPVDTNIVIFTLTAAMDNDTFLQKLADADILAVGMGPQTIRMVTHLDVTDEMVSTVCEALKAF